MHVVLFLVKLIVDSWCTMQDLGISVFNFKFWEICSWSSWWDYCSSRAHSGEDEVGLLATVFWIAWPRFGSWENRSLRALGLGADWLHGFAMQRANFGFKKLPGSIPGCVYFPLLHSFFTCHVHICSTCFFFNFSWS